MSILLEPPTFQAGEDSNDGFAIMLSRFEPTAGAHDGAITAVVWLEPVPVVFGMKLTLVVVEVEAVVIVVDVIVVVAMADDVAAANVLEMDDEIAAAFW